MTVEHKSLHGVELKVLDDEKGVIEAIVSITGVKDQVNDIIEPGAYTKTLKARKPKMVWSHDWDKPIGVTKRIKELLPGDPALPASVKALGPEAGALVAETQFIMGTQLGREAYEVVKAFGDDAEFSIGYNVPQGAATMKSGVRHIKTLDLFEYSPVLFGAMPHAKTLSLKTALQGELAALEEKADGDQAEAKHPFVDRDGDGKCDVCGVAHDTASTEEEKALLSLAVTERACVDCGSDRELEGKGVGEKPSCVECGGRVVTYALEAEDFARMSDAEVKQIALQVKSARVAGDEQLEFELDDDDLALASDLGETQVEVAANGTELTDVISAEELAELKSLGVELKRDYSSGKREELAEEGAAMSDGSFPIKNASDLKNAIQAVGRAKNSAAAKRHIKKRARQLGLEHLLPDGWKSLDGAEEVKVRRVRTAEGARLFGQPIGSVIKPGVSTPRTYGARERGGRNSHLDDVNADTAQHGIAPLTSAIGHLRLMSGDRARRSDAGALGKLADRIERGEETDADLKKLAKLARDDAGDGATARAAAAILEHLAERDEERAPLQEAADDIGRVLGNSAEVVGDTIEISTSDGGGATVERDAQGFVAHVTVYEPEEEGGYYSESVRLDTDNWVDAAHMAAGIVEGVWEKADGEGLWEKGLSAAETKGSRRSLDRSPRSNWVEESGELPGYVREIARAIERTGKPLSTAIAIAISRIKKWAAGGGDVDADTRAKAAKALAEWEALKAKNRARRGSKALQELTLSIVDDGTDDLAAVTEAAVEAVEVKAGRVLSTNNAAKLKRALEDLVHVLRAAGALETQQPQQPTEESNPKAEAEEELVPAGGPPKADTADAPAATEEKSRASAWVDQAAALEGAEDDTDVLTPEELAELAAFRQSV